ncbi:MerR family transcriptional regulator [Marisediminicola sp. LYQ85]|uniref:MerR family transcriptional regulator n=1 Tax=Marisediminicola sp. LYQ85 TaxID=3391062 RepID=UPI003983C58E
MRIGELSARTGVSVRALRYYEDQGLLAPRRNASGQRLYSAEHESVIATIRDLLDAGFCSSVIATLLRVVGGSASDDELERAFDAARRRLESEKQAIDRELDMLATLRGRWGLAPHVRVRGESGDHERITESSRPRY